MAKSALAIIYVLLAGLSLFLAGCIAAPTNQLPPIIATPDPATPNTQATQSSRSTPAPAAVTPTTLPTSAPAQTSSVTPLAPRWMAPVNEIYGWAASADNVSWIDDHTIKTWNDEWQGGVFDLRSPEAPLPLPTPFHDVPPDEVIYSPKGTYAVICIQKDNDQAQGLTYRGLQLYRVKDNHLVSQAGPVATSCGFSLAWAPDESAVSFTSKNENEKDFPYDIYAWKNDGSQPYVIGRGSFFDDPGAWSPDSKRLVVEIRNWAADNPEDEETFQIFYPDGRPPKRTKAQLNGRAQPGMTWITDEIVSEGNSYAVVCLSEDYYVASTGEHLEDLNWGTCYPNSIGGQPPMLSPNQRWFMVDKTKQKWMDPDEPFDFTYLLYDLEAQKTYPLWKSPDVLIDFAGWDANSKTFYLVRRPVNDSVLEQPDEPFGLLALDPRTLKMKLVNAEIRFAWLGPDQEYFIGATSSEKELFASVYDLKGEALTKPIRLDTPKPIPLEYLQKLQSIWYLPDQPLIEFEWSNSGQKAGVFDGSGMLWLLGADGTVRKIAENLEKPEGGYLKIFYSTGYLSGVTERLLWSPNDEYLIVRSGTRAWVMQ